MPIARWKNLVCLACGHDTFIEEVALRYHPSGGTTHDPVGLRCSQCQAPADAQKMLLRLRKADLLQEMEEMEAQSAALDASLTSASSPASNASPTTPAGVPSSSRNTGTR